MALSVTTDYVKTHLDRQTSADDSLITSLVLAICAQIEEMIGWDLAQATNDERFVQGHGESYIVLPEPPVSSVAEVYVSTDHPRVYDATTLLSSDDYIVDTERGIVHRIDGSVFPSAPQSVKVKYTHGFASVPEDVKRVVAEIVAAKLPKGKALQYHVSGEEHGEGQINIRSDDFTPDAMRVIRRYARDN